MKLMKHVLIVFACLLATNFYAQNKLSWKKHVKLAEELFKNAQYADAGNHYRAAWRQKTKNKDLIFKAAECFYILRDYRNAADSYQHVKSDLEKYPQVGLKYARSLKQSGDYNEASKAFTEFINQYQGSDKATLAQVVQNEIKGCELANELGMKVNDLPVEIQHLGEAINTPETEFAPLPFNDEILYFSSTMAKRAEIYRSKKVDGQWQKAKVPESFPQIPNDHFCNGTLSPDQKRFYFTICKSVESWGGLTTSCDIYVTKRANGAWATPEKLRDYINMAGSTTTHPYVVHQGNVEVLYFSSNRPEGKGGMDIWYTTRDKSSSDNDFSYPINAGSKVNTVGNEITPYYDQDTEVLYFASDGHVSLGGYDIFKAVGNKSQWEKPQSMGLPFCSSADDFFYINTPSGKGGFFVSNRVFGTGKITTTDEDIFSFTVSKEKEIYAEGGVYDKTTGELLTDVSVSIYEVLEEEGKRLLLSDLYPDGKYRLFLLPEKSYSIEAQKEGYYPKSYEFETNDYFKYDDFGQPLYIEKIGGDVSSTEMEKPPVEKEEEVVVEKIQSEPAPVPVAPKQEVKEEPSQPVVKKQDEEKVIYKPLEEVIVDTKEDKPEERTNVSPSSRGSAKETSNTEGTKYILRGKSKRDNYEVITSAPRQSGEYFKIQLIAVVTYRPEHSRYRPVEGMGRLDTEYIVDKKLTRVLLADYSSMDEAKGDLSKVRKFRNFERAFIVKYIDGERIGRVN